MTILHVRLICVFEEVGFMGDGSQSTKVKKSSIVDVEAIPGQTDMCG